MVLYDKLDQDSIRLIRVQTRQANTPISCTMAAKTLGSQPRYKALSYTWGEDEPSHPIFVNGEKFLVRQNLLHALEKISGPNRLGSRAQPDDEWWIDNICIYQQDDSEKERIVGRMGEIFARSLSTLAWLGKECEGDAMAIPYLTHLGGSAEATVRPFIKEHSGSEWVSCLVKFFDRPWWTRAWTLQEYILPMDFSFVCGKTSIGRNVLETALIRLIGVSPPIGIKKGLYPVRGVAMASKRGRIRDPYQPLYPSGSKFPLWDILVYVGCSDTSKPRDCIYSILGLVADNEIWKVKPEYNDEDPRPVFEYLVKCQINHTKQLDIICFAAQNSAEVAPRAIPHPEGWPSWIPYWPSLRSAPGDRIAWQSFPTLSNIVAPLQCDWTKLRQRAFYKASGNVPYEGCAGSNMPGILLCKGIKIGCIKAVGNSYSSTELKALLETLSQKRRSPRIQSTETCEAMDRVWRTAILYFRTHRSGGSRPSSSESASDYNSDFKFLCLKATKSLDLLRPEMLLWFHHNSRIGFGIEEDNTAIVNLEPRGSTEAYGSNGSATETGLERRMLDVWINMDKKMVALGDGMLGMAPRDAEVDNLVFILAGCNYPVVVRKTPVKES